MIRKFKDGDLSAVKGILSTAFDMTCSECESMLNMINPLDNLFLIEKEDKVVCVASAIPLNIGNKEGRYIYAVATTHSERNKGYATSLLKYILDFYNNIDVILLKPAQKSLFDFYKKIGFNTVLSADISEYNPQNSSCDIIKCSLDEYLNLRKDYNNFIFNNNVIEYYINAYSYLCVSGCNAIALYRMENNICYVDEVYGDNSDELIYGIIKAEKAKKAVVTQNGNTPFALAHFYKTQFDIQFRIPME